MTVRLLELALALVLLCVLAVYALEKRRSKKWGEMLFGCHVASLLIAIGLLAGSTPALGVGLVFMTGVGLPSWLVEVWSRGGTTPLAALAHLLPTAAAGLVIARVGLVQQAWVIAWTMFIALQGVSYVATAPALNVNLAHGPSPVLQRLVSGRWASRLLVAGLSLATLLAADALLRVYLGGAA